MTLAPHDWLGFFEDALDRMRADLEALVSLESPSDEPDRVSALAAWVRDRLRERGVRAETRPCPPRGDAVVATIGTGEGGTLLLGHLDTVWPVGTLAEMPFEARGDVATGPGVFDMKGGIAVGMAALEALARPGGSANATLLLLPDEEVGTAASRGLLLAEAARHRRVLVLEPSLDGAAKIARKGTGLFEITFRGRAAHVGLDPEAGSSALAELARFVLHTEGLGSPARETTVHATVAQAGSKTNVTCERASLWVDVRVWSLAEAERVERGLREYQRTDSRVEVVVKGGFDRPPMEQTPESEALYEKAKAIATELGFELGAVRVGGASDGNLTAAAGIPTLDGLGPCGGGAHARNEFLVVPDLPRRAALVARMVADQSAAARDET
jgi:glutamate carboxypeptidase